MTEPDVRREVAARPAGGPASLAEIARRRAADHPGRVAFVAGDETLTYGELDAAADRVASAFAAVGAASGDRIGYLGRNHTAYPVVTIAASRLRATSLGLNWRLPADELANVLGDAEPSVVVADHEFAATAARAITLLQRDVRQVPALVDLGAETAGATGLLAWANAVGTGAPLTDAVPSPDDIAYLVYTSGTTGAPKGVMTPNRALLEHLHTPPPWTLDERATVLIVSPVFHAVGVVWTAFVIDNGATGVFVADPQPAKVLAEVEARGVTHTVWVPALLQVLLDHPDRPARDLTSLQVVVYGASPISEQLLERAFACLPGCAFVQGYGMTETTGPVTYLLADEHLPGSPRLRTAGRAAPNAKVRVAALDTGEPVGPGVPGEVQTKSAQLATGYWRNETESANLFTADGWLRTGDVGVFDEHGYLTLTDRVKDVIISGGENVYSGEVERVLLAMPGVAEACVVGRPSERWGEAVTAIVVRRDDADGAALTADDVIEHCRERLAHYKSPSEVHFAGPLPRNPSGKVLRRLVREPFWA